MIGGVGWTRNAVEQFLGKKLYTIPCGAVSKNNDPLGRIIHDFSFPSKTKNSVNSAFVDTSVEYISFVERAKKLSKIDWYMKVDLKNGYGQLRVHPSEWHTQVYSLNDNEHYIDLINMPFGKANSSKVFCRQTTAWQNAFKYLFQRKFKSPIILESYVDDFFGGPTRNTRNSRKIEKVRATFQQLMAVGDLTGTIMNRKKSFSPARVMEVHGFIYDLILRSCRLSKKKQLKYLSRIECILKSPKVQFKCLEKLLGNLTYAAWIAPFGRPFLSVLSEKNQTI